MCKVPHLMGLCNQRKLGPSKELLEFWSSLCLFTLRKLHTSHLALLRVSLLCMSVQVTQHPTLTRPSSAGLPSLLIVSPSRSRPMPSPHHPLAHSLRHQVKQLCTLDDLLGSSVSKWRLHPLHVGKVCLWPYSVAPRLFCKVATL